MTRTPTVAPRRRLRAWDLGAEHVHQVAGVSGRLTNAPLGSPAGTVTDRRIAGGYATNRELLRAALAAARADIHGLLHGLGG
jgi:hypothetical protein